MEIEFQVFDAERRHRDPDRPDSDDDRPAVRHRSPHRGSATALDQVVEQAHQAGVIVVNWDSVVSTDQLTAIVNTNQDQWGQMTAQWLVDQLGGSGRILAINGPGRYLRQ
jgi:hypothetical protein